MSERVHDGSRRSGPSEAWDLVRGPNGLQYSNAVISLGSLPASTSQSHPSPNKRKRAGSVGEMESSTKKQYYGFEVSMPTSVVVDESPSPNTSSSEPESERPIAQIEARMAKHRKMLAEYRAKYPRKELVLPEPEERRRRLREDNMKYGKPYRSPYEECFKWEWDEEAEDMVYNKNLTGFGLLEEWELLEWEETEGRSRTEARR